MSARQHLLSQLAEEIARIDGGPIRRIGIDGIDGAGKTMFADELAILLRRGGSRVIRASVDGFHHPRAVRYRRGRSSPEGYFRDSYDYAALRSALLEPLSPKGSKRYRTAVFDHVSDTPVLGESGVADEGDILVFDGIFLHRPELRGYWDYSIFLDVRFDVACGRCAARDGMGSPDPTSSANLRYVKGQELYLATCEPPRRATVVIDNNDFAHPRRTKS